VTLDDRRSGIQLVLGPHSEFADFCGGFALRSELGNI
jgi:hypothetical protein